jgi:hypothetical protein
LHAVQAPQVSATMVGSADFALTALKRKSVPENIYEKASFDNAIDAV